MDLMELTAVGMAILIMLLTFTAMLSYLYTLYVDSRLRKTILEILEDPSEWDAKRAAQYVKNFFKSSDKETSEEENGKSHRRGKNKSLLGRV